MTNSPRRTRTDSTDNLHRILAGANIELAPPAHLLLRDEDWPFWHSIIDERAKADWSRHELEMAALLAGNMAQLEHEQRALREEGVVVTRPSGFIGPNPRLRIVADLTARVLSFRRSLGLTARAKAGSTRDAVRQREANRRTERAAADGDNLLS